MKKSTLFLACCIGLMLFASCKKDPIAPTISVFNGTGYISENASIFSGDEINVGFVATGENLTQIEVTISQNETTLTSHVETIEKTASYTYSHTFTFEASGAVTITGKVTDAAGQTATKSFNITCNEKPNAKFIGDYEGNALFTGIVKADMQGQDPVEEEVTDREMPVLLNISEGETVNEVIALWKVNDQEIKATGTVDGNKASFEVENYPYTLNYDLGGGFVISPTINMTYYITATLVDNQLLLDGTCNGEGEISLGFFGNGTVAIDGSIGGSLNKMN